MRVDGLRTRPEMNGREGRIVEWNDARARWMVRMDDGSVGALRACHLRLQEVAPKTPAKEAPSPVPVGFGDALKKACLTAGPPAKSPLCKVQRVKAEPVAIKKERLPSSKPSAKSDLTNLGASMAAAIKEELAQVLELESDWYANRENVRPSARAAKVAKLEQTPVESVPVKREPVKREIVKREPSAASLPLRAKREPGTAEVVDLSGLEDAEDIALLEAALAVREAVDLTVFDDVVDLAGAEQQLRQHLRLEPMPVPKGKAQALGPPPPSPVQALLAAAREPVPNADAVDAPGLYDILEESTVTASKSTKSGEVGELGAGHKVEVLEVVSLTGECRVRGRIGTPFAGWISLLSTEDDFRWASRSERRSSRRTSGQR